jgi:crescentin
MRGEIMKLGIKGDPESRRGRFFTLKDRVREEPAPAQAAPAEPLQVAHEIGARFELVNEKLDNAQQVAEEIRSLITLLGDLRGPIFEEFRERRIEHAELQALQSTAEAMRQRLEELENDNVDLNARAAGAEAGLADMESRYIARDTTLRSRDLEVEQLKIERAERRAQVAELDEARETAVSRVADLEEETTALRARAEQGERRYRESEALAGKLQQDTILGEQERAVLQKRLEQSNGENVSLSGRVATLDEQLTTERKRALALEGARLTAEAEITKVSRVFESKIEMQRGELNALEAKLETIQARIAKLDELNTSLTQRLADASLRHKVLEDEKLVLVLSQERALATAHAREREAETMRRDFLSLEAARAAAVERAEELARLASSRETAAKRAERQIVLLKEKLETTQADFSRKRSVMDDRLSKMQTQYERERAERAIIEGALETARRDRGRDLDSGDPSAETA